MRSLIVANGYPPTAFGGVEVYSSDLAHSLACDGAAVSVICAEHRDDLPDGEVIHDRDGVIPVFRIVNDFKRQMRFASTYADHQLEALIKDLIEDISPDAVHINHVIALSVGLPCIIDDLGIPLLYTLHDFWPLCQRVNLVDWQGDRCPGPQRGGDCYRCLTHGTVAQRVRTLAIDELRSFLPYHIRSRLRRMMAASGAAAPDLRPSPDALRQRFALFQSAILKAGYILVPSKFVKDVYVDNGYPPDQIQVLPLGLSLPARADCFQPRRVDAPIRIGFVGSVLPIKGVDVLIRSLRRVKSKRISLEIFGRSDIMPRYTRRLRLLRAGDRRIHFRGAFKPSEKDRIYGELDVLVVPSLAPETFSFVAREALLRGVPVIAARVGALPEVVQHGVNGWLFEPGDASSLAEVLALVAARPAALDQLQLPGEFEVLSVEDHVARLRSLYTTAAG